MSSLKAAVVAGAEGRLATTSKNDDVRVLLRNPRRELEMPGPIRVHNLLDRLDIDRDTVIVIRGDTLVPSDALLLDDDDVEIRPVISGGAG